MELSAHNNPPSSTDALYSQVLTGSTFSYHSQLPVSLSRQHEGWSAARCHQVPQVADALAHHASHIKMFRKWRFNSHLHREEMSGRRPRTRVMIGPAHQFSRTMRFLVSLKKGVTVGGRGGRGINQRSQAGLFYKEKKEYQISSPTSYCASSKTNERIKGFLLPPPLYKTFNGR